VHFSSDSWQLDGKAWRRLRSIASLYKKRQGRFLIVGHTDSRGMEEYNDALGMRRAEEVARALQRLGIARDRLAAPVSMGSTSPLAACSEVSAGNRRTEIFLVP
jgi:peptidoglycan-associated lipoprotein